MSKQRCFFNPLLLCIFNKQALSATFHHQVDLHPIRSRNFGLGAARVRRRRGGHIMGGTPVSSPPPPLRKDWKIGTLVIPLVRFLPRHFPVRRDPQLV